MRVSLSDLIEEALGVTTINTQTGNYTLTIDDASAVVAMTKGTAGTLTVPPNSSVAFPIGTTVVIIQRGAGQITLVEGLGVTLESVADRAKIAAQYGQAQLVKVAADTWSLSGDLAA